MSIARLKRIGQDKGAAGNIQSRRQTFSDAPINMRPIAAASTLPHTRPPADVPRTVHAPRHIGTIHDLPSAFSNGKTPSYSSAALPGEGVIASSRGAPIHGNELYSLNASEGVILTLYNEAQKAGAIVHFDNNIPSHVERAIEKVVGELRGSSRHDGICANLIGGVWLGGRSIGESVRQAMGRHDIVPTWNHWSSLQCLKHNYGAILNLDSGEVTVFEHPENLAEQFYDEFWEETESLSGGATQQQRAERLMKRRYASGPGVDSGRDKPVTRKDIERQCLHVRQLGTQEDEAPACATQNKPSEPLRAAMNPAREVPRITKEHALGGLRFKVTGVHRDVRNLLDKVEEIQFEMTGKQAHVVRERLKGILQGLGTDLAVEFESLRRTSRRMLDSSSEDSSASSTCRAPLKPGRKASIASSASSGGSSSDAGTHLGTTVYSQIYTEQERAFTDSQREIVNERIEQLMEARTHAHPVYKNNFRGLNENEEINKFVGALTEKLFSEDLTNWEETASGRGAWRLVFKRAEGILWILGVYDTHKPTYERWKVK